MQFQNANFIVFESHLFKTTSTVVQTEDCIIVVDPTWLPREVAEIRGYVEKIKGHRPVYLVLTHGDWDHVLGYGAFSDAIVIGSEALSQGRNRSQVLEQITTFDDQYYLDRDYPLLYPKVDVIVRENGQVLEIGETTLTFYQANGHTDDGIFAIIDPLGLWIAGDYLSDVEFPYIYYNSTTYEHTLEKANAILANHDVRFLIPGHGHIAETHSEIYRRSQESVRYIRELRRAMISGADASYLLHGYSYRTSMHNFHEENMKLISKELAR
ncbi:MAG: MBL fold metallo-hydrolase [Firmicutes bacterium]|nr:MBL fold metallo-hydrolase [Bacillota bacterium]